MWIRRTISKFKYWYSQVWHPDTSGFSERLGHIRCLDVRLFAAKGNPNPYTFRVAVVLPNAQAYIDKLSWLQNMLAANMAVPNDWVSYVPQEVTLNAFLTNHKGLQLDPQITFVELQASAISFLHQLEELQSTAEAGNAGHNARVLSKFSGHLQQLFRTLIYYTHHAQSQQTLLRDRESAP